MEEKKNKVEEGEISTPSLEEELEKERKRSEEYYKKFLYAMADLENTKKRFEREKEEIIKYAEADLIKEILPVLDNMERAWNSSNVQQIEDLRKGLDLIQRQLLDVLKKRGLTPIDAEGATFDPFFHEAVELVERDDIPEGTVVEEVQKGYLFKDRLLRPALVKVSKRTEKAEEPEGGDPRI